MIWKPRSRWQTPFSSPITDREAVIRMRKGSHPIHLISLLIDIKEEGEAFTEEELYAQCVRLLFAGHETRRNLIASGIYSLLGQPEKMAGLRDNATLIRSAVEEEFLRFESPIQYTPGSRRSRLNLRRSHSEAPDHTAHARRGESRPEAVQGFRYVDAEPLNYQQLAFSVPIFALEPNWRGWTAKSRFSERSSVPQDAPGRSS